MLNIDGREWLLYKAFPVHAALLRGTSADPHGNVSVEKEAATLEVLSIAQAAKNSGGVVIVQVERLVEVGGIHPKSVQIPGIYVDAVVISGPEHHHQTFAEEYNPAYSGEARSFGELIGYMPMDERKIIARRAALQLRAGAILNLGIGMPEGVGKVAYEEGVLDQVVLTVESGPIGGIPAGGLSFGASANPEAIIDQPYQFDYYDGGGLDMAFLGMAQVDRCGNVNVSQFGARLAGVGGFVNISQNAKQAIFLGSFTSGGLHVEVQPGGLHICQEGLHRRFVQHVDQISFSGDYAVQQARPILYITERAVFSLQADGLMLDEIAPGVDLQQDIFVQMEFLPQVRQPLRYMPECLFSSGPMGLSLQE